MRAKAIAWAFGLSCLLGTLVACGGGGTTQEVSSQQVVLKGRVLGAGAVAVDQALVSVGNISTATLTDGSFELSVPASASSTVVLVKKPGFGTTAKKVPLATGRVTELTLQLFPDQLITSFSAAVGISATPGGATVTIAPNSVQTSAGAPYTGTVQIAASYQDPQSVSGVQAFAQPYASADGALLQSVGVIEVKLTDSSGNALQLRPGTPATLVYPDNAIAGSATMVPLWHYDETQRIWVREGSATRRADGNYEGQVSHFTLWNADFPYVDNTTVRGCFQDASGNPVPQVLATVWSLGWEISGGSGPDGRFETRVISGVPLELKSWNVPPAFAPVAIPALAPNEVRQLACVVVDPTALLGPWVIPTTIATFTATLPSGTTTTPPSTTTAAYAGTYTGTYAGDDNGRFEVFVDSLGGVTGSVASVDFSQVYGVAGQVAAGGALSLTARGEVGDSTFAGTIDPAGNVNGTWQYVGVGGGGTFTGQRLPAQAR